MSFKEVKPQNRWRLCFQSLVQCLFALYYSVVVFAIIEGDYFNINININIKNLLNQSMLSFPIIINQNHLLHHHNPMIEMKKKTLLVKRINCRLSFFCSLIVFPSCIYQKWGGESGFLELHHGLSV